jgi:quinol monooxygenase YgiN
VIYVVATIEIRPGALPTLLTAAKTMIDETNKEVGCVSYDMFQSVTAPDTLVFVERWETKDNLASHGKSAHMAEWRAAGAPHIVDRKVEIIEPANVEVR